jgi:NAD(P)H dehydrogenase (quinone)
MAPKIAIVYYSMYGHIKQLVCWWASGGPRMQNLLTTSLQADAELKGIKEAGGDASLFQ